LLRTLIDSIPDSIYSKDLSGRKTLANKAELHYLGADSEVEVLGKDDFAFYPKELAEMFCMEDNAVLQSGNPVLDKEGFIFNKNGQKSWVLSSKLPLRNQDGQIVGLIGVTRNITEKKQAEEALFNKQLLLRTLIDNIPDSIYSKDHLSRKTLANIADIINSGVKSESEVLGKDDFAVYPKELAERFFADDQIIFQTGKPVINREEYVLDQNGQKRWLLSSKLPLHNQEGEIIGLVGIGRDITERRKAEQELKFKNEQLVKANSDKDRFMSILAHDLRSPFNTILGFLQLLAENIRYYDMDTIEQQLKLVNESAQNTYHLLDDILMWARSQSGKIPYEPKELNFTAVCSDIIGILKPNADAKKIGLNYSSIEEIAVWADIDMLKTILRNLISNAIKFTNPGGQIYVIAEADKTAITISVSDNGVGIAPEVKNQLFDISQTHTTNGTASESGTGLGLFLCKDFVEKHGGKIWVESAEGKGSTFNFTLEALH